MNYSSNSHVFVFVLNWKCNTTTTQLYRQTMAEKLCRVCVCVCVLMSSADRCYEFNENKSCTFWPHKNNYWWSCRVSLSFYSRLPHEDSQFKSAYVCFLYWNINKMSQSQYWQYPKLDREQWHRPVQHNWVFYGLAGLTNPKNSSVNGCISVINKWTGLLLESSKCFIKHISFFSTFKQSFFFLHPSAFYFSHIFRLMNTPGASE